MEKFFLFFIFWVPGFLFYHIKSKFLPQKKIEFKEQVIKYVVFSFVNLIFVLIIEEILKCFNVVNEMILASFMVILPVMLSYSYILFMQYKYCDKLQSFLKIDSISRYPSAWDFKFHNIEEGYVIIHTGDNKKIYGYCGIKSYIGTGDGNKDIYCEKIFDENWDQGNNDGVLVLGTNIKHIEFLRGASNDEE